uniref:Uncharacterized protein n=1 Tax=Chrysotila carterae TaxID=13221 RepID=A0A7S4BJ89_CHRCT
MPMGTAAAVCKDCLSKNLGIDLETGMAICRCGMKQELPKQTPRQQASRPEPPKKRVTPTKQGRAQKWLNEIAKRLGGLPSFVVKDSVRMYQNSLNDTDRKNCTDLGLALAALDRAMLSFSLGKPKQTLCKEAGPKVNIPLLDLCAQVVNRQNPKAKPCAAVPLMERFVTALCDELKLKGQWTKAAVAVAATAETLGVGRDATVPALAAALVQLVVDRQPPKDKIEPSTIATAAGVADEDLLRCHTEDLLPHMDELLQASQDAILPSPASVSLSAPAPPTPPIASPKVKTAGRGLRRKQPMRPRSKEGACTSPAPAAASAASGKAGTSQSPAAARVSVKPAPAPAAAAAPTLLCKHCGTDFTDDSDAAAVPTGTPRCERELCDDCLADQCRQCGRVDPIAVNEDLWCFGCMRETLLRHRLRLGALKGFTPAPLMPPPPVPLTAMAHAHAATPNAVPAPSCTPCAQPSQPSQHTQPAQPEKPAQPTLLPRPAQASQPSQASQVTQALQFPPPTQPTHAPQPGPSVAPSSFSPRVAASPRRSPRSATSPVSAATPAPPAESSTAPPAPTAPAAAPAPATAAPPAPLQPAAMPMPPPPARTPSGPGSGAQGAAHEGLQGSAQSAASPARRTSPRFSPLLPHHAPAPALSGSEHLFVLTPSMGGPPAASPSHLSPTSAPSPQLAAAATAATAAASAPSCAYPPSPSSADWERPLSAEDLYHLVLSPCQSPLHAPPYPMASPSAPESPRQCMQPRPVLGMPPESPYAQRGPSPRPAAGEQRALAEWAVASSRHVPSPAHGCSSWPSPMHLRAPSPMHSNEALLRRSPRLGGASPKPPHAAGPMRSPSVHAHGACGAHNAQSAQAQPSNASMPPPMLPPRPSTDPRSSPAWPGNYGADPRSSPAWIGHVTSYGSHRPSTAERPATDPRQTDLPFVLRQSPRNRPGSSPYIGGAPASPRHSVGLMLPPPPRQPDKIFTDEDMQDMLEPRDTTVLEQQYGSYLESDEAAESVRPSKKARSAAPAAS